MRNEITLTPAQLKELGVDHAGILGSRINLASFSFGWKPKEEGSGMYFAAQFKNAKNISGELAEHRMVELVKAFEVAVAARGILAQIDKTELFPPTVSASIRINGGPSSELPEDWQED